MKGIDVLVIGRSCLDNIAIVENFPYENQKVSLAFRMTDGGGREGIPNWSEAIGVAETLEERAVDVN
jgi:hypothetical protein